MAWGRRKSSPKSPKNQLPLFFVTIVKFLSSISLSPSWPSATNILTTSLTTAISTTRSRPTTSRGEWTVELLSLSFTNLLPPPPTTNRGHQLHLHNHQLHVRLTTSSSPRQIIPWAEPVPIQPKWLVSVQPW